MDKLQKILWLALVAMMMCQTRSVFAAELGNVSVRLERTKINESPLPILVKFQKNSLSSINGVKITVGNAWQVNQIVTVSTTGLPTGISPLPGIGISSVSGQTINLNSNNLVSGTNYGFFITNGVGINPTVGDGAEYRWKVETLSGTSIVDGMEVKVPVYNDDSVVVTGKVGALASDFQLDIDSDKKGVLKQGDEVDYELQYGSYLKSVVKPLILTVNWTMGTLNGAAVPTVDVAEYVLGSGTTAFGGVTPVIDLLNRKIVWTITSLPAETVNQKVSFRLKMDSPNYSGMSLINFDVEAELNGAGVVTASKTLSQKYLPPNRITPTLEPTIVPTNLPQPTSHANAEVTLVPTITEQVKIKEVSIKEVSNDGVSVLTETNIDPRSLKIEYGKLLKKLDKSIVSLVNKKKQLININGLEEGTDYYFKVLTGEDISSDVFTFRTSTSSNKPELEENSLKITAGNNILMDAAMENDKTNLVVIVPNSEYAFNLKLKNYEIIKTAELYIRDAKVLGINSVYGAEPNANMAALVEIKPGVFSGHLVSPKMAGFYEVILRTVDTNGNVSEEKISEIRVVMPLKVIDDKGAVIENAKVTLSYWDEKERLYKIVTVETFGFQNPIYTEDDGTVSLAIPKGKYRVEISEIGFEDKQVDFVLGAGNEEIMPQVEMKRTGITIMKLVNYYGNISNDTVNFSNKYLTSLGKSMRFFKLTAMWVSLVGLVVIWIFLSKWNQVVWYRLPIKLVSNAFGGNRLGKAFGYIIDEESNLPINKAIIYILSGVENKILARGESKTDGSFSINVKGEKNYRLAVMKEGYEPTQMRDYTTEGLEFGEIRIGMIRAGEESVIEEIVRKTSWGLFRWIITTMLLTLVFLEMIFWKNFGLSLSWPWVVISMVSMVTWMEIK